MQSILYGLILQPGNDKVMQHYWGAGDQGVPLWQRVLMVNLLYPVQKAFVSTPFPPGPAVNAHAHATALLEELEARFSDGRKYIMGDELCFVDITLASLSYFWALDDRLLERVCGGGGKDYGVITGVNTGSVKGWNDWKESYQTKFPLVCSFVKRLYDEDR